MKGLQKMLGLEGIDFEALGKQLVGGIDEYNRKLDMILENQRRIMLKLGLEFNSDSESVQDVKPIGELQNGSGN